MSFIQKFIEHAGLNPEHLALVLHDSRYSYDDLLGKANKLAHQLSTLKSKHSTARVGILASRSVEAYSAVLAALISGVTYLPINPKQPKSRIIELLKLAAPDALVLDQKRIALLDQELSQFLPNTIIAPEHQSQRLGEISIMGKDQLTAPIEKLGSVNKSGLAYILFTSGSTGTPKGVMISLGNLEHFVQYVLQRYELKTHDRVSQFYELSFDLSALEMFLTWCSGATLFVVPEGELLQPAKFIKTNALTVWSCVPSIVGIMQRLKVLGDNCFPSLRLSLFGGEALNLPTYQAWNKAAPKSVVENIYGPTELTVCCSFERVGNPPRLTKDRDTISIGKPSDSMLAAIVDQNKNILGQGQVGELCFSGPQAAQGYLGNAKETERKFIRLVHPAHGPTSWYLTGDLAYQDEQGYLYHLGRIDNQIKLLGHRIELEEVEAHLLNISAASSVACVAWPRRNDLVEGIVAFVAGTKISADKIMLQLKQRLPSYMLPSRIILKETLPLTLHAKIDRKALVAELNTEP